MTELITLGVRNAPPKRKKKAVPTPKLTPPGEYEPKLTVLSFGGGQDSTAILYMLAFNSMFRKLWAPNDLVVVMADTGREHPETYIHVQSVKRFCEEHGIEFWFLTADMGFHRGNWQTLDSYFAAYDLIMSAAFNKSCTDNLKIQPIYRFLNKWVSATYGFEPEGGKWKGKKALVDFADEHGPVRVLLGIAKGEEGRLAPEFGGVNKWMRLSVMKAYPLIWLGWDRQMCQDYIRRQGMIVPPPSNCMFCPFMDKIELLWLARKYPADFDLWCEYEHRKLAKFEHRGDSNHAALHASKTLPEVLADARKLYGDWSLERLEEHRFSHGHCTMSRY
jgi:3'-phosphoadenosine 5'-phosphosulfate sulfotransferase (PAPS reductase)/FAD synthetase